MVWILGQHCVIELAEKMRIKGCIFMEGKYLQMVKLNLSDSGLSSSITKSRWSFISGMDGLQLTAL
jgi:hypothetical protein